MSSERSQPGLRSGAAAKRRLRAIYRDRRRALSETLQSAHAEVAAEFAVGEIGAPASAAFYVARDGELDPAPLIARCRRRGVAVLLPVLARDGGAGMAFAVHEDGGVLVANRYGIAEPAAPCLAVPQVVFAPLVAFDAAGRRLGLGGGHYDRCLRRLPQVLFVGLAHECQRAPELPQNDWDVPLDAVVTEAGWQDFSGRTRAAN